MSTELLPTSVSQFLDIKFLANNRFSFPQWAEFQITPGFAPISLTAPSVIRGRDFERPQDFH